MSSSKSNTNPVTTQSDNRRVVGENGISAENSILSITNSTLDADVVSRALAAIQSGGAQAFDFGGQALADSLNASTRGGAQAFDFGSQALAEALGFGGGALKAANTAAADALDFASSNNQRNTQALSSVLSDSFGSMDTTMARAFSFGSQALDLGFGNLSDSQQLVADAYSDAKGRGALTDKILIGAIGAMALVAFAAVGKK